MKGCYSMRKFWVSFRKILAFFYGCDKIWARGAENMKDIVTVYSVADWFIRRQPVTHKKLQKLVYYAYAWYYTLRGKKLFDGQFEAWIHGPVNRKLYGKYAEYGWNEIEEHGTNEINLPKDVADFLETIEEVFGGYTADELESMTHQEQPWIEARGDLPPNQPCCNVIKDCTIKDFYGTLAKQNQVE